MRFRRARDEMKAGLSRLSEPKKEAEYDWKIDELLQHAAEDRWSYETDEVDF